MKNFNNPAMARAVIQTTYDNYASGRTLLPRGRLTIPYQELPRKSQHAGRLLTHAWRQIDTDQALFDAALMMAVETGQRAENPQGTLIALRLGFNAVNFAQVSYEGSQPQVGIGQWRREEFLAAFTGVKARLTDGRS